MSAQFDLKNLVNKNREGWDHPGVRTSVRQNFERMIKCRTAALGAEVYTDGSREYLFFHSCKSRSCPSCGWKATLNWQRKLMQGLPDVDYVGICFTIPGKLRLFFKLNRDLLHDLPALAAEVIQGCIRDTYHVTSPLIAVLHTFGEKLNFHPHVHILVAAGGLQESTNTWLPHLFFDEVALAKLWQATVIRFLRRALSLNLVSGSSEIEQLEYALDSEEARLRWMTNISRPMHRKHLVAYAARYACRPPIAQSRIVKFDAQSVEFLTKDRKKKLTLPLYVFIRNLAEHVPDHYRHTVRCFGLWSPRGKNQSASSLFLALGLRKPTPSRPLLWRESILKDFGRDPLLHNGRELTWVRQAPPNHS